MVLLQRRTPLYPTSGTTGKSQAIQVFDRRRTPESRQRLSGSMPIQLKLLKRRTIMRRLSKRLSIVRPPE
jgi:hypothetical protein